MRKFIYLIMQIKKYWIIALPVLFVLASCSKKEIEFGGVPENAYTKLVYVDTVSVQLSTVLLDSFQTNGATSLLLGKYKDPYLGTVSCRPFFQLSNPSTIPDIPASAVFDSLLFIIRTNHYYYGDTSRPQTIQVQELAQTISYSYNDKLYNTTDVAVKPVPLGTRTLKFSPSVTDSITIRLDNSKGLELYNKLLQKEDEVTDNDAFLNYFKGISLSVGGNDTTAVFGLTGASSMVMRVVYHHTTPTREETYIDFPLSVNDLVFNQVLTNRSGTGLDVPGPVGVKEIASVLTGNHSFSQYGTGVLLKMTFPSLKGILKNDNIVKLMKAELIIRPAALSFDRYTYRLPSSLFMLQTDGSNIGGSEVMDPSGSSVQKVTPVTDYIYGENSYYGFNVTPYINQLLNTGGSEDDGFFLLEETSTSSMHVNRVVVNDANRTNYKTQLLLSLLVINK